MKFKLLPGLGLVFALGLSGCGETKNAVEVRSQWLDLPALPILQNAVLSLADTLAPHKQPLIMEQLCALARGDIQQENVNAFIQQQGGNAGDIPAQGHPLSLLVNGDRQTQASTCAAYLASTVLSPLSLSGLMIEAPPPATENKNGQVEKTTPQIDQAKLLAALPHKLAIAQTNADVFALIAAELQSRPGLTLEQYRQLSIEMFANLAPAYLQRVKAQLPPPGTQYKVLKLDADQFIFISSTRTSFAYDFSGLKLLHNGITWFGEGKLLGKDYFLKVAYLPENARQLAGMQL
ncbi:hypothetical protein IF690_15740 [Pseudomonas sp. SK3(2021)]|uniref:hypothetical protein n=1 Tax=Pseudomonas sp. SK3(2021) TaxID=2841064 RepID=UPI00192BA2C1|nr:hypothetical protein [Pseudomonas sp. SK3(2021)]QQZ39512.1 hypothetical protein IF690_15740 [Pseudomonas sp. SK3(2021)]